ncbi:MAG: metallophosphoesterase, partial [Thermoplasmata archaeon]|nr:metallophosphoesterase [Thermoplasmata archaeon]
MEIEPVLDEAALVFGKSLLVADLHIGIEEEFRRKGYNIPSQTHRMEKRLVDLIETHDVERLIILGDLKHSIIGSRQDYREVRWFLEKMVEHVGIELVKGNHDGGLQHLTKYFDDVKIHGPKGVRMDDVGLVHGHAHPSEDIWKSRTIIAGHEHPVVKFVDRMGMVVYMKTWLRMRFKKGLGPEEFIVVPAFNDYLGGTAVNTKDSKFLGTI